MAIRVKFLDKCEYIVVTDEILSSHSSFLRHVLSHFGLDSTQAATAYILDQDNFQITAELFPIIIRQFQNPAVHIRIIFNFHENTAFDLELETYLRENGCKSIFLLAKDAEKSNLDLDTKSLNYMAEKLVHFIEYRDATGVKVEPQDVVDSVARLMPCVKADTLYAAGKKGGILYQKLFYRKYVKKTKKGSEKLAAIPSEMDEAIAAAADEIQQLTLDEEFEYLSFFRTCFVDRDKEILKIKMKQSIGLREKTIRKRETKFAESFPFYFLSPDLILYDFILRFGFPNSFIDKFPKIQMKILSLLNMKDAEMCTNMGFDGVTTAILMLLRSLSMKKTFELNANTLIVYSNNVNECPDNLINKKTTHPYIIAVGEKKDQISNYYIDIEENLIPIPGDFNFLQTFDMFFKCHKIFHLEYNPSIVKLMHFIDYFIFEDKENQEIEVNITMKKISEKLNLPA